MMMMMAMMMKRKLKETEGVLQGKEEDM